MIINLPDLPYKDHGWNEAGQLRKIREEYDEVEKAYVQGDPANIVRESLDLMQTCVTMINMQVDEFGFCLDKFLTEHREKLIRKGYLDGE